MDYAEHLPSLPLRAHVRCIWTLSAPAAPAGAAPEPVFPDGCMEWVFHFGDRFRRLAPGGPRLQPRAVLAGQLRGALCLVPTGTTEIVAARLTPCGAWPLLGVPLDRFVDTTEDLIDVLGSSAAQLLERLGNAPSTTARVALLDAFLLSRLAASNAVHDAVRIASAAIEQAAGHVAVDDLAARARTSGRHLERLFLREIGVPPKLLCRVLRFQGVFEHLGDAQRPDWAAVALASGYYDQAHFVRDFRAFTATTPSRWLRDSPALAGALVGRTA